MTAQSSKKEPRGKSRAKQDSIEERAYQIYNRRIQQGLPGEPDDDWYQAEKELKSGQ